jgi:hypothetical protein
MTTAVVSLILPVFLPSYPDPHYFAKSVIGATTVTMFALSFPLSLLGLPLLMFAQIAFGFDPNSISGMYLTLFSLFVMGLTQWFLIVPWIFRAESEVNTPSLRSSEEAAACLQPASVNFAEVPSREKSPVEVLIETESRTVTDKP